MTKWVGRITSLIDLYNWDILDLSYTLDLAAVLAMQVLMYERGCLATGKKTPGETIDIGHGTRKILFWEI